MSHSQAQVRQENPRDGRGGDGRGVRVRVGDLGESQVSSSLDEETSGTRDS